MRACLLACEYVNVRIDRLAPAIYAAHIHRPEWPIMVFLDRLSLSFRLLPCLLVASCATIKAGSDHYAGADFSKFHSYAWVADSPLIRSESRRVEISPLTVRRVEDAIERELGARSFEHAENRDAADFAIAFTIGARDTITIADYPPYYRTPWSWDAPYYGQNIDPAMYTEGTLAIDIFDNATQQPVWHGWATKTIRGSDIDDPEPTINAAVAAILADFPPK